MTIIWTIMWLLIWLSGSIIVYILGVRMDSSYPHNWDNGKRSQLAFIACFSWACIALFIIIGAVGLIYMGGAWLSNRYAVPILKKLEPKVGKK